MLAGRLLRRVPHRLSTTRMACCSKSTHVGPTYAIGPPVAALVPPGQCQFTEEWTQCELLSKVSVAHDVRVFTFATPDRSKPLNLPTCACILATGEAVDSAGNAVVRPYTPVSTNATVGKFELMIKVYPEGKLSKHLDMLQVGAKMGFKHIPPNVKIQYPFGKAKVGMIAGGTGITPIMQALHAALGTAGDTSTFSLLYGSRTTGDILARDALDEWQKAYASRLSVTHVLSAEPEGSAWPGVRGNINRELIEKHLPKPSDDCVIMVCGPPPMYHALCGPRDQKELSGVLAEMGFSAEQVYKF